MPTFLMIYMAASITAVILESTMNFNLFANRKEIVEGEPKESMLQSMKAGVSYLRNQPILMTIIWISLVVNFLFGAFQVGYSFVLIEKLKMISTHFGYTEGALAVGMLLTSIYLSIRKEIKYPLWLGKWGIVAMGIVIGAVAVPLLMHFPYNGMFAFYLGVMFCFGILSTLVNTPMFVMMQKLIDDDYKGRVFSLLETMAMALMPIGMVLFGLLYDIVAAQLILLISSAALITVVLVMARPSVVRKAHPELDRTKTVNVETV